MNWAMLAQLIITDGLAVAESVWTKWKSGKEPTEDDWKELKQLSQQTARDRLSLALARSGIAPTDPQATKFAELVPPV